MNITGNRKSNKKFETVLVITYGRSGSTLLQGILNNNKNVLVRGENMNMCFYWYKVYLALLETKKHEGNSVQSPFFGSSDLNIDYFLSRTRDTVKKLLLANVKDYKFIDLYGFKEIRYANNVSSLNNYLDFLKLIFPKVCFVFNTRSKVDVINSWINLEWKTEDNRDKAEKALDVLESAFNDYIAKNKENSFHITYEDITGNKEQLIQLHEFLEIPYKKNEINDILNLRHSYKPNQKEIESKPYFSKRKSYINLFNFIRNLYSKL